MSNDTIRTIVCASFTAFIWVVTAIVSIALREPSVMAIAGVCTFLVGFAWFLLSD